jgi:8-oxo-dGTP pyrophosphatase MutT (NUDIX family)
MSSASDPHRNPWQTQATRIPFENRWIRVVQNDVLNPSGRPGEYTFVHFKFRAVAVVPLDEELHTWLVGQFRYATNSYQWEIPAGGCPENETPRQTAERELQEETGLVASRWEPIFQDLQMSNSITDEVAHAFLARNLAQAAANPEETEALALRRLSLDEAVRMALAGEIQDAFSVMTLMMLQLRIATGSIVIS